MYGNLSTRLTRILTMIPRRNPRLRHIVSPRVVRAISRARSVWAQARSYIVLPAHRSEHDNIFHCCVHKTGSQWIKSLLQDPVTYKYSGLWHYHYQRRGPADRGYRRYSEVRILEAFPVRTVVSPLYLTYENYRALPKPGSARAFFVGRDPRDIVVSWYYSAKKSHILDGDSANPLVRARKELCQLPLKEGLLYAIEYWREWEGFDAMRSWFRAGVEDSDVKIFCFEDLVGQNHIERFRELFSFLDIQMPEGVLRELLDAYSFERLSGRTRGATNNDSHLRTGKAGDWRSHFDGEVEEKFEAVAGDMLEFFGRDCY